MAARKKSVSRATKTTEATTAFDGVPILTFDPIKHVIVLMMENRSFDHMLGALPNVDGIDPVSARTNTEQPGSNRKYAQEATAARKIKLDPHHETKNVLRQIDGAGLGPMGGFIYDFALEERDSRTEDRRQVMAYFDDGKLPALHQLAKEYCVCDRWFSSVPGPTWANRFFMHSGTSQGWVKMPSLTHPGHMHKYDQTTIYDRLNERNVTWRIYRGDIPQAMVLANLRSKRNRKHFSPLSKYFQDVAHPVESDFPAYTFIEPKYFPPGQNDQHPPHDVLKGDELIASIYNALRANNDLWASSLLIITWDEHGGFYDHVSPPAATPPDHNTHEYTFDRLGVRVPTVLISPWVKARSVFRAPAGVLDHTSILKYLVEKYDLAPLGNRTASVASIRAAILSEAQPSRPKRVGTEPKPLDIGLVPPGVPGDLNQNQLALIEFTRQLELEMGAAPSEVGLRAIRGASGVEGQVEAAKERVRLFLGDDEGRP
jgi:phospholipase C